MPTIPCYATICRALPVEIYPKPSVANGGLRYQQSQECIAGLID